MTNSRNGDNGARVEELRANMDRTRQDISRTISEIEARLRPDRMKNLAGDRVMEAMEPWRRDPMGQAQLVGRDLLTRLREMAWMNPIGLGLGAAVVGFLLGRRRRTR